MENAIPAVQIAFASVRKARHPPRPVATTVFKLNGTAQRDTGMSEKEFQR